MGNFQKVGKKEREVDQHEHHQKCPGSETRPAKALSGDCEEKEIGDGHGPGDRDAIHLAQRLGASVGRYQEQSPNGQRDVDLGHVDLSRLVLGCVYDGDARGVA